MDIMQKKIISLKSKELHFTKDEKKPRLFLRKPRFIIYLQQYYNFSYNFSFNINFKKLKYIIGQSSPSMLCHDNHSTLQYISNFTAITIYYINTNGILDELACENISSNMKTSLLLWLHNKSLLSD